MPQTNEGDTATPPQWRCSYACREYQGRTRQRHEHCRGGPEFLAGVHPDLAVFVVPSEYELEDFDDEGAAICLPLLLGAERAGWTKYLRGRSVTLCPVANEASRQQFASWGRHLRPLVSELHWLELPDTVPLLDENGDEPEGVGMYRDEKAALHLTSTPWNADLELSAADLLAEPAAPWLVEGLLPAGLTVLTGRPGLGTSSVTLQLALVVAGGTPPRGAGGAGPGDVLYCALAEPVDLLRAHLPLVLGDEPAPPGLSFRPALPSLDGGGVEVLKTWAVARPERRLIVVDGYERIVPRHPHLREQTLAILNGLARKLGIAILAVRRVAHLPRAPALSGVANHLVLQQEGTRHAVLSGRTAAGSVEMPLDWDPGQQRWKLSEEHPTTIGPSRRAILEELAVRGPLTPAQISAALALSPGTTRSLLWRMRHDGQLLDQDGRYLPVAENPPPPGQPEG